MKEIINDIFIKTKEELYNSHQLYHENSKINSILIDKSFFDIRFCNTINISEYKKEILALKENKINTNPVLYWFELVDASKSQTVKSTFIDYRENIKHKYLDPKYRNTSSYKKEFISSEYLYIGKVEKGFWGRIVTHLGYNQSEKTAGMQLFHWYDIKDFGNIELNYIVFNEHTKNIITILEKKLAKRKFPLIGRY